VTTHRYTIKADASKFNSLSCMLSVSNIKATL